MEFLILALGFIQNFYFFAQQIDIKCKNCISVDFPCKLVDTLSPHSHREREMVGGGGRALVLWSRGSQWSVNLVSMVLEQERLALITHLRQAGTGERAPWREAERTQHKHTKAVACVCKCMRAWVGAYVCVCGVIITWQQKYLTGVKRQEPGGGTFSIPHIALFNLPPQHSQTERQRRRLQDWNKPRPRLLYCSHYWAELSWAVA